MNTVNESLHIDIAKDVVAAYRHSVHQFFTTHLDSNLSDGDVVILLMNIILSSASEMYCTIREFLPNTKIDFDFCRATLLNSLAKNFEQIKDYNPKNDLVKITPENIKDIQEKGFATVKTASGKEVKITEKDLLFDKSKMDNLLKEHASGVSPIIQ